MTKEEVKHINWMYNRLTSVHNENPNYDYMLKFKEIIDKQLNIAIVSESTYPKEFVHLAKGNYLDKDGSIKEAQTMKDHLGNEYFMVAKDKLYSR